MKRFKWFGSVSHIPQVIADLSCGGQIGALIAAAVLLGFSFVVGCTKEKNKTTSEQVPATTTPAPAVASSMPSPAMSSATLPPAPKKVVRKRPANVIYSDQLYGVSFRYPRRYPLKTGDKLEQANKADDSTAMDFVQPGGVGIAAVQIPKGAYPGTDLSSAFFQVNVNKSMSELECEQFALPEPSLLNPTDERAKVHVGDMDLQEIENITPATDEQADAKFYHVYRNSACYEFTLGMKTAASEDNDNINPVDRDQVFRGLEKILATVKIKPEDKPETAATAPAVPANQDAAATK